jgi:tetratricopeptide (TPR) repeat protein
MKLDPILSKATMLARSGKYSQAIRALEPEINRYHGSFRYYYILAVSCLHVDDYSGALGYFQLAQKVKLRDPLALLGMAALYLRRGETDRAVDSYLEVLDNDEKNKIAKRALHVIRKYSGRDEFQAWLDSGKLRTLYPPIPSAGFSWERLLAFTAAAVAAFLLLFGILAQCGVLPNPFTKKGGRVQNTEYALSAEDRSQPVQTGGGFNYTLTRTQVIETYEKARSLFTSYRDEAARINLNRILESNASEGIQNKARLIIPFLETPGFHNFKHNDNVSYSEAAAEPALYRDVHVIWRGMAVNVQTAGDVTSFKLLVGYDTRKTLEGDVQVAFDRAMPVSTERPLEVLGRIVPVSGGIMLEGVAIKQSGRLEEK